MLACMFVNAFGAIFGWGIYLFVALKGIILLIQTTVNDLVNINVFVSWTERNHADPNLKF